MGEYADMAIDSMMEVDYQQLNGISSYDDDPYWNPFTGRWRGFHRRPKTCKRCGQSNLWWGYRDNGWRLETSSGDLHLCAFKFKSAIGKKSVDSRVQDDYNAYLDTVPWPTEAEYALQISKDNASALVSGAAKR